MREDSMNHNEQLPISLMIDTFIFLIIILGTLLTAQLATDLYRTSFRGATVLIMVARH
jgi:hypothetical protein